MPKQLYPYQLEGIQRIIERKTQLLDIDTGGGKTAIAFLAMYQLVKEGKVKTALIVCPVNAKSSWERPLKQLKEEIPEFNYELHTSGSFWLGKLNYSDIHINGQYIEWTYNNYDFLVLDESHQYKSHDTSRTLVATELGKEIEYKVLMSATPKGRTVADYWSQMQILHYGYLESRSKFINKYCILNDYFQPSRDRNNPKLMDELMERLSHYIYVVPKEVTDKYKPKQHQIVHYLDKTPEIDQYETEVFKMLNEIYDQSPNNIMHEASMLYKVYAGIWEDKYFVSPKVVELINLIDELPKPLVIFTMYNPELFTVKQVCENKGLDYEIIRGGVSAKKRSKIRDRFNDRDLDVLILNIASGDAGLDLKTGQHMIFFSVNPSLIKNHQGKGRIARNSSEATDVYYHYLVMRKSVEADFFKLVQNKITSVAKTRNILLRKMREVRNGSKDIEELQI